MAQAMSVDEPGCVLSATELEQHVDNICNKLIRQELQLILKNLHDVSEHWSHDIETKSEVKKDIFQNGAMIRAPYSIFCAFFEYHEKKTSEVSQNVMKVLQDLRWHINRWKTHQLHDCVKRRLEGGPEDTAYVEKLCEKVLGMVRLLLDCGKTDLTKAYKLKAQTSASLIPAPVPTSPIRKALQDILKHLVQECFVVIEQPQLTMMFEKEKKDKDDSNNSKRFDTTVGLLGGKALEDCIEITDVDIILVYQGDLDKNLENIPHAKICSEKGRQKHSSRSVDTPDLSYQRKYEKLRVEGFNRKETRTVYKQLYRVLYTAKVIFKVTQKEFEIPAKVISLPVIMRTGANQASEHVGALLWHSFSSSNVNDLHTGMAMSMSIDSVIQMIHERILFIGGRGLMPYERQFLHARLSLMAASGRKKNSDIALDSFVKDKVELATNNAGEKHTRPFTLWLWLHSIFNLLQETLLVPWIHGVIYGFGSREHCTEVLEDPSVPDRTFLLRFSESYRPGNYMFCKGGIGVVLKLNGKACFAPPIQAETIEREGLAHAIEQCGGECELTTGRHISDIRQSYPPTVQDLQNTVFVKERYPKWEGPPPTPPRPMLRAVKRGSDRVAPHPPEPNKMNCSTPPQSPDSGVSASASSPTGGFSPNGAHDQSWMNPHLAPSLGSPGTAANLHTGSPVSAGHQMGSPVSSGLPTGSVVSSGLTTGSVVSSGLPTGSAVFSIVPVGSAVSSSLPMGSAGSCSVHMVSPGSCSVPEGSPASSSGLPAVGAVPIAFSTATANASGCQPDDDFDEQLQRLYINAMLNGTVLEELSMEEGDLPYVSHYPSTSQACGNFLVGSNDPVMTALPL